jgi:DNA-binding LacI/PurR family transcriptional regulator
MSNDATSLPRLPTLEDVAVAAGVSRATVSRVINNTRNVDPALHSVVWDAVAAIGYVPNKAARSLVTRRAGSVALVVSEAETRTSDDPFVSRLVSDPFFGRVVWGTLSVLSPAGVHLPVKLAGNAEARTQLIGELRQGQFDGALVISLHPHDPLPQLLTEAGVTAVLFGRPAEPIPISYVDIAHQSAARLAADRLVQRGCRSIATISGSLDMPTGHDRLTAFRTAMAQHGYAYVPSVEGNYSQESGERAMEQLLAEQPDVDGIFVANDLMAQGALVVLRDHGRRVPDDVAVVGFDDSSAALASRPQLTTVRQPVEEMAAEMARLLLAQLDQPERRTTSVIFEPNLVERQSA